MNIIAALLSAAALLGESSALERNLEEPQRRLWHHGSTFDKYVGIYERCCAPEFEPNGPRGECEFWFRTVDWGFFSFYDWWEDKCDTSIAAKSSIVQLASETDDLSTLVSLLTGFPDLVEVLSSPSTFTVFAPTNDAFDTLFETVEPNDLTEDQVRTVLLTHVLGDVVKAANLEDDATVDTLNAGESLTVDLDGGAFVKAAGNGDNVEITQTDLHTSNGVVHKVSGVLLPGNL